MEKKRFGNIKKYQVNINDELNLNQALLNQNKADLKWLLLFTIKYFDQPKTNKINKNNNFVVSLNLVNSEMIAKLNLEYRATEGPTDVLTFPNMQLDDKEYDMGDIFINTELLAPINKNPNLALKILFIHGLLHILGYNHKDLIAEEIMFNKQNFILDKLITKNDKTT